MADPIAVIIRFRGDPDDLIGRFENARERWAEAQDDAYGRPVFYAACKSDEGIVIVTGWETALSHRAFGHPMGPHLQAAGMGLPDHIERLRIAKLGWNQVDPSEPEARPRNQR